MMHQANRFFIQLLRFGVLSVSVVIGLVACGGADSPTTASIPTISASSVNSNTRWVSAWQAPPTDAVTPGDPSLTPLITGPNQTFRLIFSPLGTGTVARLHLTNRFGASSVVFSAVTIAKQISGAAIDPSTLVNVTFSGQAGVTISAGQDVVSDPVDFSVAPFDNIAVSIAATEPGVIPTHHFTARQTSFATLPAAGDHSVDAATTSFVQSTTARPFMVGMDVVSNNLSTILTFGDSITDGFQGPPSLVPQNTTTIDLNERYPDYLKHMIDAAGLPFTVSNAGISGNQVLQDAIIPPFGPSALHRVNQDGVQVAGVGTVIFLEGINDLGQNPTVTAAQLEQGYITMIQAFHQAGYKVLQGTLTPCGSSLEYGTPTVTTLRQQVNQWIRTQSPADGIVDFDAAVRDANNPNNIAALYDGGDGLHFSAAGYQRLAEAIDLTQLVGSQ